MRIGSTMIYLKCFLVTLLLIPFTFAADFGLHVQTDFWLRLVDNNDQWPKYNAKILPRIILVILTSLSISVLFNIPESQIPGIFLIIPPPALVFFTIYKVIFPQNYGDSAPN